MKKYFHYKEIYDIPKPPEEADFIESFEQDNWYNLHWTQTFIEDYVNIKCSEEKAYHLTHSGKCTLWDPPNDNPKGTWLSLKNIDTSSLRIDMYIFCLSKSYPEFVRLGIAFGANTTKHTFIMLSKNAENGLWNLETGYWWDGVDYYLEQTLIMPRINVWNLLTVIGSRWKEDNKYFNHFTAYLNRKKIVERTIQTIKPSYKYYGICYHALWKNPYPTGGTKFYIDKFMIKKLD